MSPATAVITHPISLCAYVISVICGLLARKWNSRSRRKRDRQLFYLASSLCVVALVGGLFIAWQRIPKTQADQPNQTRGPSAVTGVQTSSGKNSPNVISAGSGSVTLTIHEQTSPTQIAPKTEAKKE